MLCYDALSFFFFFNDTATTEIYTLSLHDALPISVAEVLGQVHEVEPLQQLLDRLGPHVHFERVAVLGPAELRSEEHTSELQSRSDLVCRLLLEKKKSNRSGE